MKNFAIITDSCSDLDKAHREAYDIDYAPMGINYEDKEGNIVDLPADLDWKDLSVKEFYDLMRNGTRIRTSQVRHDTFKEKFEEYLKKDYDIIYLSCSGALSASIKASRVVREELLKDYPDAKIYCIDSLNSCAGLGLLCMNASALRKEGKTIEEVAAFIEENKLRMNQFATVEDMTYLKRAGRISAMKAAFGGLLGVKPVIISDALGQNTATEKPKGRKNSIRRLAQLMAETYVKMGIDKLFVLHADNSEDGQMLVDEVKALIPDADVDFGYIGPIIGATTGPGTLAVYGWGKEVTYAAHE